MAITLGAATVCFLACHGGPANHFPAYAEALARKGYLVQIYATGPALEALQKHSIEGLYGFSLEDGRKEEEIAKELALKCRKAAIVITDVGDIFNVTFQEALASVAPETQLIAYYDNDQEYVPGGYSATASKVMQRADKVLFANANLANVPIYRTPSEEVPLPQERKIGLGYYPLEKAQQITERRSNEQAGLRAEFFSRQGIVDSGQKVFVYAGGNNEVYFSQALPACLQFISELSASEDLSNVMIVLQQHPGAKIKNSDVELVKTWLQQHGNSATSPRIVISDMSTDDALVLADAVFYYQTSMAAQFALAQIPSVQIGHEPYKDILVKNNLCLVVNNERELASALKTLQEGKSEVSSSLVKEKLGIRSDWAERLEEVVRLRDDPLSASNASGLRGFFSSKYLFAAIALAFSPIYAALRSRSRP